MLRKTPSISRAVTKLQWCCWSFPGQLLLWERREHPLWSSSPCARSTCVALVLCVVVRRF